MARTLTTAVLLFVFEGGGFDDGGLGDRSGGTNTSDRAEAAGFDKRGADKRHCMARREANMADGGSRGLAPNPAKECKLLLARKPAAYLCMNNTSSRCLDSLTRLSMFALR